MTSTSSSEFVPSVPFRWLPTVEKQSPPISSELSIPELTRLLARGDEGAFREFHGRYFDSLHRFLLVVARGNEDEAGEALQQTMLRVAKYAREFGSDDEFWSWLKAVARSAARDGGRKRGRYEALLRRFAQFAGREDADTGPGMDVLAGLVDESMEELPGDDRAIISKKYLDGMRVSELAAATGLTEKAVEARLGRIRAVLRSNVLEKLRQL